MKSGLKAVIFDMDGVLIESESLWRRAMMIGFKEFGMVLSEDDCRKTMGLRIGEVIQIWFNHFSIHSFTVDQVEERITNLLIELIEQEGHFIEGIPELLAFCREKKIKTGLATSSSGLLMKTVLRRLKLTDFFDSALSAEHLPYGKPHPEVFLNCAKSIGVDPLACVVIEDSINGMIAGKAARMKVIVVPDEEHKNRKEFQLADYYLPDMKAVLTEFKTLFASSNSEVTG